MDNCIIILITVLLASSYLFQKSKDSYTNQLLYVVGGLSIIIIMKHYYINRIENFQNANNSLVNATLNTVSESDTKPPQDWDKIQAITADNFTGLKKILAYLKGINESDLDKEETKRLIATLSQQFGKFEPNKLDHQLTEITTLLKNLQNVSNLTNVPDPKESTEDDILAKKSIKESQFLQDIEIKKLEDEIDELNKIYTSYVDVEAKKTFKKIPIYSSCVMEANGSTTSFQPALSDIALQTKAQKEYTNMLASGGGLTDETDPTTQSINKLIKSISEGGINISMRSK